MTFHLVFQQLVPLAFQRLNLACVQRACLSLCILLCSSLQCTAQIMVWKANQVELPVPTAFAEQSQHHLTISAAAEPQPSLKYRFRESAILRQPGSAGEILSRARYNSLQIPNLDELQKQYASSAERWHEGPLPELLDSDLKEYLDAYAHVLKLVHAATRQSHVELLREIELDGERISNEADFSQIQDYRQFAELLTLQARWELASGHFDEAIECIGTGFRLAEILEIQKPSLISKLVGLAICGLMHSAIEELEQQAACPNLYWALASVPNSTWDCADALDGEMVYQNQRLGPLMKPVPADTRREEILERLVQTVTIVPQAFDDDVQLERAQAQLISGAALLLFTDKGREELIGYGFSPARVGAMSPAAVLVHSTQLGFAKARDSIFKWVLLDGAEDRIDKSISQFQTSREFLSPGNALAGGLFPSIQAMQSARDRAFTIHRRTMLIEALRAHAAKHGELPQTLNNLDPLPAPINPRTGQKFEYERSAENEARIRNLPLYPSDRQTETVVTLRTN